MRRRDVLVGGMGVLAGAAVSFGGVGVTKAVARSASPSASPSSSAAPPSPTMAHYESTMLVAPVLALWQRPGATVDPGLLFVTPNLTGGFSPVIYDAAGSPVWIGPDGDTATDLRVQRYRGEDVLTYWAGRSTGGNGKGRGVILDRSYRKVAEVSAVGGVQADLHEFELTDRGTALLTAYPPARRDLRAVGGPKEGWIYDCHVQEVDVATGRLLLDWRAGDHVALAESYQAVGSDGASAGDPYDPYHVNAVSADSADTLLVSARHTHTIYSLDRSTGRVRWRLGGRKSDFEVAQDAAFAWQHHARRVDATHISMFDNHTLSSSGASRGLVLAVDESARTASLERRYARAGYVGTAMGSVQLLDGGHVLVGWGTRNAVTEFAADGTALWEASGIGTNCYRAARAHWTAAPDTAPAVHARRHGGVLRVFMSWNGATGVSSWRVATGPTPTSLETVAAVARDGFETGMTIASAPYVRVQAVDASGAVLASSAVIATAR